MDAIDDKEEPQTLTERVECDPPTKKVLEACAAMDEFPFCGSRWSNWVKMFCEDVGDEDSLLLLERSVEWHLMDTAAAQTLLALFSDVMAESVASMFRGLKNNEHCE